MRLSVETMRSTSRMSITKNCRRLSGKGRVEGSGGLGEEGLPQDAAVEPDRVIRRLASRLLEETRRS